MREKLAKQIKKNNKKRNLNIVVITIAGFLFSSGVIYGREVKISDSITDNNDYRTDPTITLNATLNKEVIYKNTSGNMTIKGNDLTINHTITGAPSKNIGTISASEGNLEITVNRLNLNLISNFTDDGVVISGIKTESSSKIGLNAEKDINIKLEGKGTLHGIENSGKLEINPANLLKIESGSEESVISMAIFNSSEGNLKINSADIVLTSFGNNKIDGICNDGKLTIDSSNTIITSFSKSGFATGIASSGSMRIDNAKLVEIKATSEEKSSICINVSSGNLTINSSNTILTSSGNYATGIYVENDGYVGINGGLEIKAIGKKNSTAIFAENRNSSVIINKDNQYIPVKIEGNLILQSNGKIDVNFNGNESYLIGNTSKTEGTLDLGFSNGAVWKNEGDSEVTKLNLDNGIIDMTHKTGKQTIEIKTISGNNGKIVMDISSSDINQTGNETDYIKINAGTSQTHNIEPGESSILSLKEYDFNEKILIGETAKNVNLKGSNFTDIKNIFDYSLDLESQEDGKDTTKNNWYVTGMEKKEGAAVEGVVDDLSLHYMNAVLARMEADTLHKRLGDIHSLKEGAGVWARTTSGQMESDKNGYFKNDYTMIQAGVDKSETTAIGTWTTGFAIHRTEGKADFRNGDGKNESTGISLYKSWFGNDSQYLDLVGKFSHLKNEYKSYNVKNEKMEANYHTNAGTLSLEYGKRLAKEKWYAQPHAQMTYTWIDGKNYNTSSNIRAEQKDINSLIGKVGIYAGYDFERSSHFVKAGVLHEFMGDYGVTIKGADASVTKNVDGKDSWVEIGIGGDIKVGKTNSMNVYYELEKTFGGDFEINWQATLGMRYKF